MEKTRGPLLALAGAMMATVVFVAAPANAASDKADKRKAVIDYWTPERRAAAQPRDMVVDHRGLGFLRRSDGSLQPYGHRIEAVAQAQPQPQARPGGSADTSMASTPIPCRSSTSTRCRLCSG